jgi:hypothetical protein
MTHISTVPSLDAGGQAAAVWCSACTTETADANTGMLRPDHQETHITEQHTPWRAAMLYGMSRNKTTRV